MTTLLGVMIVGLVAIVGLLVTRFGTPPAPLPTLPANLILPEGATPAAITFARAWLVVVTDAGDVLLYNANGGPPVSVTTLP